LSPPAFRSPNQNFLCISHLSHLCHISHPSCPPWFDDPNIRQSAQVTKSSLFSSSGHEVRRINGPFWPHNCIHS
jgi:hypothetical protein